MSDIRERCPISCMSEKTHEEMKKKSVEVAEYCAEHCSDDPYIGCDCPYAEAFNAGWLCGLYGYPKDVLK